MNAETSLADVYFEDEKVGHFFRAPDGGTEFRYTEAAIAAGRPISASLPLSAEPVVTHGGALPPFFSNLLPEGRRLSSLTREAKTSADDELGMLLHVGSNPIGAVSVVSPGEEPASTDAALDLDKPLDFSSILASSGIVDPVAIPGVQDKASAKTIAAPIAGRRNRTDGAGSQFQEFILKVSPPEYPALVENEAACFELASRAGKSFPTAETRVLVDGTGRTGLLVTRFDRVGTRRLPTEDGAQILGIYPADKYRPSMEELASAVMEVSRAPMIAARLILHMNALAWLTGNGDFHAKNISVIDSGRGYEVAPLYDIPSTLPYGDSSMALELQGKKDNISGNIFRSFGREMGLPDKVIESVMVNALRATEDAPFRIAEAIDATARQKRDLTRLLSRRRALWGA